VTTSTDRDIRDIHQLIEHAGTAALRELHQFRQWLDAQAAGHATHVPIAEVRRVFGWPRKGTP
jgi:hypothetical protein